MDKSKMGKILEELDLNASDVKGKLIELGSSVGTMEEQHKHKGYDAVKALMKGLEAGGDPTRGQLKYTKMLKSTLRNERHVTLQNTNTFG